MKVYQYRLWCITENTYVYTWRDEDQGLPTACPNNTSHIIDSTSIVIVETIGEINEVKIIDTDKIDYNKAIIREQGFEIDVGPNVTNVEYSFSFPFVIEPLGADFMADYPNANRLDSYDIHFVPYTDPVIGITTASKVVGDTVIAVSSTVFNYIGLNYALKFGTDTNEYYVKSIDTVNSTVTLFTGLINSVASNTEIRFRIPLAQNKKVYVGEVNTVGAWSEGAKNISANTIIRVRFTFASATVSAFKMLFNLYYKYQP